MSINMTSYEIAKLRLKVWKALEGWGAHDPELDYEIDKKLIKGIMPWGWEQRQKKADEFLTWLVSPFSNKEEAKDENSTNGDRTSDPKTKPK
jgi:hypothetical protein